MESKKVETGYVVRLTRGEEFLETLQKFCTEKGIISGWFTGMGSTDHVKLAYYDIERREYIVKEFPGPLEIVNLTGNVAQKEGATVLHVHGTFSGTDYQAVAGHIDHLKVGATLEIYLQTFTTSLARKKDEATGLNLLDFTNT